MRCLRHLLPATLILSAPLLASCAGSPGKLSVNLQAIKECQRLGGNVAVPSITVKSDYRILSAQALGQINQANRGARQRTACEDKVINEFAGAK